MEEKRGPYEKSRTGGGTGEVEDVIRRRKGRASYFDAQQTTTSEGLVKRSEHRAEGVCVKKSCKSARGRRPYVLSRILEPGFRSERGL